MSSPAELLCNRGWRLRHGAWMLWGILSLGLLAVVGFAIIGFRARNRTWLMIAGGWLVYTVVIFAIYGTVDFPDKGEASTPLSSVMGGITFFAWVGAVVLQWFVNRKWLIWLAHNSKKSAWYQTALAPTATPNDSSIDDAFRMLPPPAGNPNTALPAPTPTSPAPAVTPPQNYASSSPSPQPSMRVVDVNSASVDELAQLPGLDHAIATQIVATRQRVGLFTSPADLVTTGAVPPHVFAPLRTLVTAGTASAPSSKPPTASSTLGMDGRRLDF